jgi:hypothetical protein
VTGLVDVGLRLVVAGLVDVGFRVVVTGLVDVGATVVATEVAVDVPEMVDEEAIDEEEELERDLYQLASSSPRH